jgi:hypothetical protein
MRPADGATRRRGVENANPANDQTRASRFGTGTLASVEAACYSQVLQAGTPEDTAREWRNWQTRRT